MEDQKAVTCLLPTWTNMVKLIRDSRGATHSNCAMKGKTNNDFSSNQQIIIHFSCFSQICRAA